MALNLQMLFPFLRWRVDRNTLKADMLAGMVGAVIVLPQGVAFATLAGLPPEYGLYAAMVPAVVAALWGSSFHLVSGPTNAISLVVLATLSPLAAPGSSDYIGLALTLAFMVGVMQLAMGLARLGILVNFISHTVVVGFTAGAALLIFAAQAGNFFGFQTPRGAMFFQVLGAVISQVSEINPYILGVGMATLLSGAAARKWLPHIPYMLVAMIVGSLTALGLNHAFGLDATGIRTIGALPGSLPTLSIPRFSFDAVKDLLGVAVAVTSLGLIEAVSIARSIALKSGQRLDANQEFIGQGLSNISGSFFSAYPVSGSFNRSGLNHEAGAITPMAAAAAAVFLVPVLFLVAPLIAYLPFASLAAVLFLVAWGLFDFKHIRSIFRTSKRESAVLLVTLAATLLMHLEMAILVGIVLSLILYLHRTSRPAARVLLPDASDPQRKFHEVRPEQVECPQLKIVRIEGSLYFGAVSHVGELFHDLSERHPGQRHLLLMSKSINFVDVAGAELLAEEARRRGAEGGRLWFYSVRKSAADLLHSSEYISEFGEDAFFTSKREAISHVFNCLDRSVCSTCHARVFIECQSLPHPSCVRLP